MAQETIFVLLFALAVVDSQYWNYYTTRGSSGPSVDQYSNYFPIVANRETFSPPQSYQPSTPSCDQYFFYQNDYNGQYGLLSVPIPGGNNQIRLKVKMTLAARLQSVRNHVADLQEINSRGKITRSP